MNAAQLTFYTPKYFLKWFIIMGFFNHLNSTSRSCYFSKIFPKVQ